MFGEGLMLDVVDIKCHPTYDFAIGYVARQNYKAIPMHGKRDLYIAESVLAYGFTNQGLVNGRIVTAPRLLKGILFGLPTSLYWKMHVLLVRYHSLH
jgi:hypothetical protein